MELSPKLTTKLMRGLIPLFPVIIPIIICFVFYYGITCTADSAINQELSILEQALHNGTVHYYSLTGEYPPSLEILKENYRITYDSDKFIVEYIPNGSNLFPMIDVLLKSEGGVS